GVVYLAAARGLDDGEQGRLREVTGGVAVTQMLPAVELGAHREAGTQGPFRICGVMAARGDASHESFVLLGFIHARTSVPRRAALRRRAPPRAVARARRRHHGT